MKVVFLVFFLLLTASLIYADVLVIGDGTATQRYPLGSLYGYERSAAIYNNTDLDSINIRISSISWFSTNAITSSVPTKIYFKTTNDTILVQDTWDNLINGASLLYDATHYATVDSSWNDFIIESAFDVEDGNGLLVLVERNYGGEGDSISFDPGITFTTVTGTHQIWQQNLTPPDSIGTVSDNRPNIKLNYTPYFNTPPNPAILSFPIDGTPYVLLTDSLQWSSGGGEPAGYRLYFGTTNPPDSVADLGNVLSFDPDLEYGTTYYWQVVPYNDFGDAVDCPVWNFTTINDPTIINYPYQQNFDAIWLGFPSAPIGWTIINADSDSITWMQSNQNLVPAHSEPYAACGTGNTNDYLITPLIDLTGKEARIKWWDKVQDSSYLNSYKVLVSTTDNEISSFTAELGTYNCSNNVWTLHSLDLLDYTDETIYIAFYQFASASVEWGFGIDDVLIEDIPPILSYAPAMLDFGNIFFNNSTDYQNVTITNTGLGVLSLTTNDISLTGIYADQFELVADSLPVALTGGQSVTISLRFIPTYVGTKPVILRIVYDSVAYDISVVGTALSDYSLNEGFESTTFPPFGWTRVNGGDTNTWVRNEQNFHSGIACASIAYNQTVAHNDWLITPKLVVSEHDKTFSFWSRNYSDDYIDIFNVKLSTTTYSTSAFTYTLDSNVGPGAVYTKYSYDLTAFVGQVVFIAVQAISIDKLFLYLDDFIGPERYANHASPNPPILSSPANGTTNLPKLGFNFIWAPEDPGEVLTGYTFYLATSEDRIFEDENGMQAQVTATTFNPVSSGYVYSYNTRYYWTVKAQNRYGISEAAPVRWFKIQPDPTVVSFPWSESFESATFPPMGWMRYNIDSGGSQWNLSSAQNHTTSGSKSALHSYSSTGIQDGWLISPPVALPANLNMILSFWSYNMYPYNYGYNGVLISTGSYEPSVGPYTEVWSVSTVLQSWVNNVVNLSSFAGQTVFIAFKYSGVNAHNWFLDDVRIVQMTTDISPPTITHLPLINTPRNDVPYRVEARIVDDTIWNNPISGARIYYHINLGTDIMLPMTLDSANVFYANIPAQNNNSSVYYYIQAWDSANNIVSSPSYSFYVGNPAWLWYDSGVPTAFVGSGTGSFGVGNKFKNPFLGSGYALKLNAVDGFAYSATSASLYVYGYDGNNFNQVAGPIPVNFRAMTRETFNVSHLNINLTTPYFMISYEDFPAGSSFALDQSRNYGSSYWIEGDSLYAINTIGYNGAWLMGANVTGVILPPAIPVVNVRYVNNSIVLTWNHIAGATSYKVYGSSDLESQTPWAYLAGTTLTQYTYSGTDSLYFFRVTSLGQFPARELSGRKHIGNGKAQLRIDYIPFIETNPKPREHVE